MHARIKTKFMMHLSSLAAALLLCSISLPAFASEESNTHALHSGPSSLSVVTAKIADGDTVQVLEHTSADWTRIALEDGTTGYCDSTLLSIRGHAATDTEAPAVGETLSPVSVLSAPEADAPAVGRLAANVYVSLLSDAAEGAYAEISVKDQITGYIDADSIRPVQTETATVIARPTLAEKGVKTEAEAREKLKSLALYFEDGLYWNCAGAPADADMFCVTGTPCVHSVEGYASCNTYSGKTDAYFPEYSDGTQCLGYASLLSDLLFGTEAPVTIHYDFDRVRVGDHIRLIDLEHSVLVTETGTQADGSRYVRVTEVNADYESCKIAWGRTITEDELYGTAEILTRYGD
ncbi:MAG: SH3 domain-containing protein [Acutalibacteraceae bacterium]